MKKFTRIFLLLPLSLLILFGCGKSKNLKEFGETFAGYVNSNEMDSVLNVYSIANFDSLAQLPTDSIEVSEEDGEYKISFGEGKWIKVEISKKGRIEVIESNGVAAFPEENLALAIGSGMFSATKPDVEKQTLLRDSAYFEWLHNKIEAQANSKIKVTPGPMQSIPRYVCEGWIGKMNITLTNTTDNPIAGSEYAVTYTMKESNGCTGYDERTYYTTGSHQGMDLAPGESKSFTLSRGEVYNFFNFKIAPKNKEEFYKGGYEPTGNEYREYLQTQKQSN